MANPIQVLSSSCNDNCDMYRFVVYMSHELHTRKTNNYE